MVKVDNKVMKKVLVPSILVLGVIVTALSFVYGAAIVTHSSGSNITYMEDDTTQIINITINVTTAGLNSNITAVVINISGLVSVANFTLGSESDINTSLANHSNTKFRNLNYTLNWTNIIHSNTQGGLINDTVGVALRHFWFNLSALAPIKHGNISILLMTNGSLTDTQRNMTIHINDTFNLNFISGNAVNNYANLSQNYIYAAVNVSGNETGVSINLSLSNGTGGANIIRTNATGHGGLGNASGFIFNYSGLTDGTYYLNATVNSTSVDKNESLTRRIIIDRTNPAITLTKSTASTTKTQLVIDISVTDATSVSGSCTVDSSLATITGSGTTQTLTESSLSCETSRTYVVSCTDHAGNTGSASITAATSDCGNSGPASSSGGSSGSSTGGTTSEGADGSGGSGGSASGSNNNEAEPGQGTNTGEEGAGGLDTDGSQAKGLSGTAWVWIVVILLVVVAVVWYFMKRK
jgi:hypothetical protein